MAEAPSRQLCLRRVRPLRRSGDVFWDKGLEPLLHLLHPPSLPRTAEEFGAGDEASGSGFSESKCVTFQ